MRFLSKKIYPQLAYLSAYSLLICLVSGLVLSFHYFPDKALMSVLSFEASVPFGRLFRSIHYFSAQILLVSLFFHLLDSITTRIFLLKGQTALFFLGLSFPLILYLTFTGYILRGDETGQLAGAIADTLTRSLPLLGEFVNRLFFALSQTGLHRVYLWHLYLSFLTTLGLFNWHFSIKRLLTLENARLYTLIVLLPGLIFYPSLRPFGEFQARGPWFFLGAQSMLRFIPPELVFLYLLLFPIIYQAISIFPTRLPYVIALFGLYVFIYVCFTLIWFLF